MYPFIIWYGSTGLVELTLTDERDDSAQSGCTVTVTIKTEKGSSGTTVLTGAATEVGSTGVYRLIVEHTIMTIKDHKYFADITAVDSDGNHGHMEDVEVMCKRNTARTAH